MNSSSRAGETANAARTSTKCVWGGVVLASVRFGTKSLPAGRAVLSAERIPSEVPGRRMALDPWVEDASNFEGTVDAGRSLAAEFMGVGAVEAGRFIVREGGLEVGAVLTAATEAGRVWGALLGSLRLDVDAERPRVSDFLGATGNLRVGKGLSSAGGALGSVE